ncbi:MAG: tRNA dihydrouridine(20/20a) synthase DusA [Alphaproteobacteria bacterium]
MSARDPAGPSRRFCVAPMMDWTDRHDRYFLRLLSAHALLYTEMVTTGAVIHGDRERLLGFDPAEHPIALQIGGSDPDDLCAAARIGADWGYDEINLNVGCPSDRVQSGRFGACLMREPALVAEGVAAMTAAISIPVTVKCRIGVDDQDPAESLPRFVETVAAAGCRTFIVHARKAWLQGLSPKDNRSVPPLDYPLVYALKRDRPDLAIVINGGIGDLDAAEAHLGQVDGVMLGRAAYQTPYLLAEVDRRLFGAPGPVPSRDAVLDALEPYIERHLAAGGRLHAVTRHIVGLYQAMPGARAFRRVLSEDGPREGAGLEVLHRARAALERRGARSEPAEAVSA